MLRILPGCLFSWCVQCYWAKFPHLCYYSESAQNHVDHKTTCCLVISLSFLLVHISSRLFVIVVFSLPQSPSFSPFIWTSFYPPDHISSFAVIRLGITSLNKCGLSGLVKWSLSSMESLNHHDCRQTPMGGKRSGFFFHWCNFQPEAEMKAPKVQVWYNIVSGYVSKGSLIGILCLPVTHWNWLADGNFIIL